MHVDGFSVPEDKRFMIDMLNRFELVISEFDIDSYIFTVGPNSFVMALGTDKIDSRLVKRLYSIRGIHQVTYRREPGLRNLFLVAGLERGWYEREKDREEERERRRRGEQGIQ